jgi:hypothetical protein
VQHEYDRKCADEAHAEPENERHGKGELGKKDDGIEDVEIGKIDVGHQLTMKRERGAVGHLFGPVLQGAIFLLTLMGVIQLIFWAVVLLLAYGVVVLVFRFAFGVELPNPFDLI